ncbi:hypothetical protein [Caballeronia sp. INDeC2]|uniref:hypothetical protein n=1 Tax=Caballeronia sp. INDeC2 TaxID=2921747 RepID=UPI00202990D8|nr:hypothetical protein [Caballeronia sp. INDeC2]
MIALRRAVRLPGFSGNRRDKATHVRLILSRLALQRQAKNFLEEHSENSRSLFD